MHEPRFIDMIIDLRRNGRVILYQFIPVISEDEMELASEFLRDEYNQEAPEYPFVAPGFDSNAAVWAAITTYKIAQLILYRDKKIEDLESDFMPYTGEKTASAYLSADLCLRFVPQMVFQLEHMDPDDELVGKVNSIMQEWPYSEIGRPPWPGELDTALIASDPCLRQLFTDRIIERKDLRRAGLPVICDWVATSLGIYQTPFWKEFTREKSIDESNGKTE